MDVKGIRDALDDAIRILEDHPKSTRTPTRVRAQIKRAQNILWNGIGKAFDGPHQGLTLTFPVVNAIDRVTKALDPLVQYANDLLAEKAAREADQREDWRTQKLSVQPHGDCPYCTCTGVRLLLRGTTIFGCAVCLVPFFKQTFPEHWKD